jgi:hypothetical protein
MGKEKVITFFLILLLTLIASFRGNTFDTAFYVDVFHNIDIDEDMQYLWNTYSMEYLFLLLTFFLRKVTVDSVWLYFFTITFLSLSLIYYSAKNFYLSPINTLLIFGGGYYWLLFMSQMRLGLAISIAYFATSLIINKKYKIYLPLLLLFISCLIHYSIFIYCFILIFYLLSEKIWSKPYRLLIIFILICLSHIIILSFLYQFNFWKIEYYLSNPDFNVKLDLLRFTNLKYIVLTLISIFTLYKYPNKLSQFFCFFMTINLGIRIGYNDIAIISGRVASLFSTLEIFFIPYFLARVISLKNFVTFICVALFILSTLYTIFVSQSYISELYFTK